MHEKTLPNSIFKTSARDIYLPSLSCFTVNLQLVIFSSNKAQQG